VSEETRPSSSLLARIEAPLVELQALGALRERSEAAAGLAALERSVLSSLLELAASSWMPGRGVVLAELLTAWRDAAMAMILGRVRPVGFAVVALGGWARRRLAPFSDLDLLMLCPREPDAETAAKISEILYHLWDAGYRVASSTRALRDIRHDAAGDPHFLTSLLDARLLGGDAGIFAAMSGGVERALARSRARLLAEWAEEVERTIENAAAGVLLKEPDVKLSPGGLRSVQLLGWLERALAGSPPLERLLSPAALTSLRRSEDFLLFVRAFLHLSTARREDVLRIGHQAALAEALGMRGPGRRAMVRLMRLYYERATHVALCLLDVVDHGRRRRRFRSLGAALLSDGRRLSIRPGLPPDPATAMDAAIACARLSLRPTGPLVRWATASARLLASPDTSRERDLFLRLRELLGEPRSHLGLALLKLAGFLPAYLSPLRAVMNRIEHNPFHSLPVDQHSLQAVHELECFGERASRDSDRYASPARVLRGFRDSVWVAKLALLLHDTGKAYEGEHAKNGAEVVRSFMRGLPTERLFADMVVFLTENHLLLSSMARRRAAGDDTVVETLALELSRRAFPLESLELLYVVSCADVAATNERAYNQWTAASLAALYRDARARLEGLPGAGSAAVGEDAGRPEEIPPQGFRLGVAVWNDHLRITVAAPDRRGLFSLLAGILLVNGADIVRASIRTRDGTAVDEFYVTEVHGHDLLERRMERELSSWTEELESSFQRYWRDPDALDRLVDELERGMKAVHPAFRREPEVSARYEGEGSLFVEISCTDRPALLYDLTHRMAELGLDVRSAAVDTTGWYVHDGFALGMDHAPAPGELESLCRELGLATEARPGGGGRR